MIKGMTISDAAHRWVSEFNRYPESMIRLLMNTEPDDWREVTMPAYGNRVYVLTSGKQGEVSECFDNGKYRVDLDGSDESVVVDREDLEVSCEGILPMWSTLWSFGDNLDDYWLEEKDGIKKMSECGFRIYHHEEWGYFFGIDGAGYDFYEHHWIPLYRARGLEWHDTTIKEDK